MNISPCVDSQYSVVVKECDEIYHLGRNEGFELIAILKFLNAPRDKYCRI